MEVTTYTLGTIEYQQAVDLQLDLAARIAAGGHPPALLLLEHPHVYTFGRQGKPENLLWDQAELARRGITVHHSDRGGDVTYHGPGQLVGYPLIPLGETGTLAYLRSLETALIQALAGFGVTAVTIAGQTGVWVPASEGQPPAKIASIGVRVDAHRITRHGFALNVNPEMAYWQGIIACGLENQAQTSLAERCHPCPDMATVRQAVCGSLAEEFGWQLKPADMNLKPGLAKV
jgi:lipoate-protein ligase B